MTLITRFRKHTGDSAIFILVDVIMLLVLRVPFCAVLCPSLSQNNGYMGVLEPGALSRFRGLNG